MAVDLARIVAQSNAIFGGPVAPAGLALPKLSVDTAKAKAKAKANAKAKAKADAGAAAMRSASPSTACSSRDAASALAAINSMVESATAASPFKPPPQNNHSTSSAAGAQRSGGGSGISKNSSGGGGGGLAKGRPSKARGPAKATAKARGGSLQSPGLPPPPRAWNRAPGLASNVRPEPPPPMVVDLAALREQANYLYGSKPVYSASQPKDPSPGSKRPRSSTASTPAIAAQKKAAGATSPLVSALPGAPGPVQIKRTKQGISKPGQLRVPAVRWRADRVCVCFRHSGGATRARPAVPPDDTAIRAHCNGMLLPTMDQ